MSLYNRLTQRDAPVAGPNPNMTPMTRKPMSLRDAVQKYARGGDVDTGDMADKGGNINDPYNQQNGQGSIDPNSIDDILRMPQSQTSSPQPQYAEPQQPQYTSPPEPQQPRYTSPQIPDPYGGYTPVDQNPTGQGPTTGRYRQNPDGSVTEIGYDGQPVSSYTPEQKAMNDATQGINQPIYDYVYQGGGEGYKKVLVATPVPGMSGVYQRVKDGAIVDKSGNLVGAGTGPGKVDPGPSPLPTAVAEPYSPDIDAPYPLAPPQPQYVAPPVPQYAVPPQPYTVMPPDFTSPVPNFAPPEAQPNYGPQVAAAQPNYGPQPASTNLLQNILGGPGLGAGLPGSGINKPTTTPYGTNSNNSLDSLISMLNQRNQR